MWNLKVVGISVAACVACSALSGFFFYQQGLNKSAVEIAQYEKKVTSLQEKLNKAQGKVDVKVVTEYQDRVKEVEKVVYETKTIVKTSVPEQHKLSEGWVYAYNQSVAGHSIDPVLAGNAASAATSDKDALLVITENNGICLSNKAQLDALQQWVRETEKARAEVSGN